MVVSDRNSEKQGKGRRREGRERKGGGTYESTSGQGEMPMVRVRTRVVRVVRSTSTAGRTDRDGAGWLEFVKPEELHCGYLYD